MTGPGEEHERFMRKALAEAEAAGEPATSPIGAVLVLDGEIVFPRPQPLRRAQIAARAH